MSGYHGQHLIAMKGIFLYAIKHDAGLFPRHRLSVATRQSRAGITFHTLVGGIGQNILPSFRPFQVLFRLSF